MCHHLPLRLHMHIITIPAFCPGYPTSSEVAALHHLPLPIERASRIDTTMNTTNPQPKPLTHFKQGHSITTCYGGPDRREKQAFGINVTVRQVSKEKHLALIHFSHLLQLCKRPRSHLRSPLFTCCCDIRDRDTFCSKLHGIRIP